MQSFQNLKVWEKAHAVTLEVYKASRAFPRDELYGLTSQMRRASASLGANIAEAHVGRAMPNSDDFSKSRLGQLVNSNITCSLRMIFASWNIQTTSECQAQ
jgi:hypothetical protein